MRHLLIALASGTVFLTATLLAFGGKRPDNVIANYRSWHKVTPRPLRLSTAMDALCRGPQTPEELIESSANPHRREERHFQVFVNDRGARGMLKKSKGPYPVGTVIVKEKLPKGRMVPELRTVMRKREKGYDPTTGDWEYRVYSGGPAPRLQAQSYPRSPQLTARGALASCISCHVHVKDRDYVFGTYLPRSKSTRR